MQLVSAVKSVMVTVTEPKVIPDVMLATCATNDVMNFQAAATVRLGPPAH
jgi:hypothetical protein